MNHATLYQDFLTPSAPPRNGVDDEELRLARVRGKARAEGFADGVATAEASFDRDLRARIDATSAALSTFASEKAVADEAGVEAVRRVIMEALTAFLPTIADSTLPAATADAVATALQSEMNGTVIVEAHPDRLSDVELALSPRDKRISFREDPALPTTASRVFWRDGFDHIDTAEAITAGLSILNERLRTTRPTGHNKDTDK